MNLGNSFKICLTYTFPPIPNRNFDWQAHIDGYEEAGPYGSGRTFIAAIEDLVRQIEEESEDAPKR
jgi:hypothetical protein